MTVNKIVFGRWEAITLLITMISTKCIMYFPRTMAQDSGTAGWIEVLFISVLALLGFALISKLYAKFKGMDLIDIGEDIGGSAGRIITGLVILLFLLFLIPIVLREFGEQMKILGLVNTPISVVQLFFAAGMIVAGYFGLEAIVRFQAITVAIVVVSYVIYIIMLFPLYDFTQLTPILGTGLKNIFGKGFFRLSEYAELLLLFLITPFIKTNKNLRIAGYAAIGLNTFFLITVTLANLLVIPYPAAAENSIPVYILGRLIRYDRFFQRIESIFVTTWSLVGLMYLSTGFYFILHVFKKTFKLEYTRPLIWPFVILVFSLSLLPPSLIAARDLEVNYFRNWAWIIAFILPIVILLIARIRKGRRKREDATDI